MPRRKIQFVDGYYYHVYNRGVDKRSIFLSDDNYVYLLGKLKELSAEFSVTVIAYCLMKNHYHLLLRQNAGGSISELMKRLFISYTQAFNIQQGRSGTLFEDRFEAIWVDKEDYLWHLCRYIHGNPVKDGMVESPSEWPFSNYHEWVGERNGTLFDPNFVETFEQENGSYKQYLQEYLLGMAHLPTEVKRYLLVDDD